VRLALRQSIVKLVPRSIAASRSRAGMMPGESQHQLFKAVSWRECSVKISVGVQIGGVS
jgi:hypothetical protein